MCCNSNNHPYLFEHLLRNGQHLVKWYLHIPRVISPCSHFHRSNVPSNDSTEFNPTFFVAWNLLGKLSQNHLKYYSIILWHINHLTTISIILQPCSNLSAKPISVLGFHHFHHQS
jgi:hypothetical protein